MRKGQNIKIRIPITRPTVEPLERHARLMRAPLQSGMLTNGENVRVFEGKVAGYLGVKHAIAVSSCTSGLMLCFKALGMKGEVIMPSFTFMASGHATIWAGLTPVFADIEPETYTLDPDAVERAITAKTVALYPTHVFGVPANMKKFEALAKKYGLKLIADAAHAFGSVRGGRKVGSFGDAEVFSLTPTKVLTAAEGGIVATNDDMLAAYVRAGRNYGDDGTGHAAFSGLSARMSEFNAAIGLRSFAWLPMNLKRRTQSALRMKKILRAIEPRLQFQTIPKDVVSTYKDLSAYVDPTLGFTRDDLHAYFAAHGIATRKYFFPPLHRQRAFAAYAPRRPLPVTEEVSSCVLSLPLYAHLSRRDQDRIASVFKRFIHERA